MDIINSFPHCPVMVEALPRNLINMLQGRGVHVTGVSAAYTFKLNKNILSE
jgi:hypothetical protein